MERGTLPAPPAEKDRPDFTATIELCKAFLAGAVEAAQRGADTGDRQVEIFESALQAVYGPDVWRWLDAVDGLPVEEAPAPWLPAVVEGGRLRVLTPGDLRVYGLAAAGAKAD